MSSSSVYMSHLSSERLRGERWRLPLKSCPLYWDWGSIRGCCLFLCWDCVVYSHRNTWSWETGDFSCSLLPFQLPYGHNMFSMGSVVFSTTPSLNRRRLFVLLAWMVLHQCHVSASIVSICIEGHVLFVVWISYNGITCWKYEVSVSVWGLSGRGFRFEFLIPRRESSLTRVLDLNLKLSCDVHSVFSGFLPGLRVSHGVVTEGVAVGTTSACPYL